MFENLGMRSSSTVILLIPLAFFVGAIASESLAFAAKETMGKPFLEIWDAIYQLEDNLPEINTTTFTPDVDLGFTELIFKCESSDEIIIGADLDTDAPFFTSNIDTKQQEFKITVLDLIDIPQVHVTLSCLGV